MTDSALASLLSDLERQVGPDRVSALRREAARRKVSILTLLAEAIVDYSGRLAEPAKSRGEP